MRYTISALLLASLCGLMLLVSCEAAPPAPTAQAAQPPVEPAAPAATEAQPAPESPPAAVTQPVPETQPPANGAVASGAQGGVDPFEQWMAIAKTATREKPMMDETAALVQPILDAYTGKPNPLLGVLEDKDAAPMVKVLATINLKTILDPGIVDTLIGLLTPEHDNTTRACAADLLGLYKGKVVDDALKSIVNDEDRRIRFLALRGLAIREPQHRKDLHQWWAQPDATVEERYRIVETLGNGPISDSVPLFLDAASRQELPEGIRMMAIDMAGRAGSDACTEPLNKIAEADASEEVRKAAAAAVAAIKERGGNPAMTLELPAAPPTQAPAEAPASAPQP